MVTFTEEMLKGKLHFFVQCILTYKANLEYFQDAPLLPYGFKWYMDNLLKEVEQLDLKYLFLHSDETVYCKVVINK